MVLHAGRKAPALCSQPLARPPFHHRQGLPAAPSSALRGCSFLRRDLIIGVRIRNFERQAAACAAPIYFGKLFSGQVSACCSCWLSTPDASAFVLSSMRRRLELR